MFSLDQIIGLDLEAAEKLLKENFKTFRVVEEDGNHNIVTRDFKPDRVNLIVVDEKVSSYSLG